MALFLLIEIHHNLPWMSLVRGHLHRLSHRAVANSSAAASKSTRRRLIARRVPINVLENSIRLNKFVNLQAVNADIRRWQTDMQFDLVSCNPPSFTAGKPKDDTKKASFRHQLTLTDDDVAAAAFRLLKDNGKLCVCQRPDQLASVIYAMKKHRIEPKVIRFVRQRKNSPHPWLVLVDGRKNGGVSLTVMPDLIMEDESGGFSQEVLKIYDKI